MIMNWAENHTLTSVRVWWIENRLWVVCILFAHVAGAIALLLVSNAYVFGVGTEMLTIVGEIAGYEESPAGDVNAAASQRIRVTVQESDVIVLEVPAESIRELEQTVEICRVDFRSGRTVYLPSCK